MVAAEAPGRRGATKAHPHGMSVRGPSAELGADANQTGPRLDACLARKARRSFATENVEQLFFLLFRGREQVSTCQDFDVAGTAAGRTTRKRNRREGVIANVDELPATFDVNDLRRPDAVAQKLDLRHVRPIAKTGRPFNEETASALRSRRLPAQSRRLSVETARSAGGRDVVCWAK